MYLNRAELTAVLSLELNASLVPLVGSIYSAETPFYLRQAIAKILNRLYQEHMLDPRTLQVMSSGELKNLSSLISISDDGRGNIQFNTDPFLDVMFPEEKVAPPVEQAVRTIGPLRKIET